MGEVDTFKYVPALKWRAGEKLALSKLDEKLKPSVLPLIELVNDEGDNSDDLSKDIVSNWPHEAYLDVHYRKKDFAKRALDNIAKHFDTGVDVIPVVWLDSPPLIIDSAKNVALMCNNGAAVRIDLYDDQAFDSIQNEVDIILNSMGLKREKADLIIDFRYTEVSDDQTDAFKQLVNNLEMSEWRRVTIASGVVPAMLTEFKSNADNFIIRNEQELWVESTKLIGRGTLFSDYTVRNPENIDKQGHPSISVRYTLPDHYQIFKGKRNDEHFKYLVHGLNITSLYDNDYPRSYSWGDEFIHEKAQELADCLEAGGDPAEADFKPGGFTNWIAASINHHMTVVLRDDLGVS